MTLFLLITVVRVFLTNPVMKRCLRYRAMDIPSDETNKQTNKKLAGKGRVGKLTTTKNNYG